MESSFTFTSLGQLRLRADWRLETLHPAPQNRFLWITRGQGRITVGASTRGFGPHTAAFVPTGTMMSLDLGAQVQGTMLGLPSDRMLELPTAPFHMRVTEIDAHAHLTGYLETIEREQNRGAPAYQRMLQAQALMISAWITRRLAVQDGAVLREKGHILAERFIEMVETRFRSGEGIAGYAKRLGVTPTHLSRVCRDCAGRPAHALLQERIMHEARRLLADTDLPAREVAEQLGFSSAAYFTRAFSNNVGKTPSDFRAPTQGRRSRA